MNTSIILISLIITLTQLADAYLRYLAFRKGMEAGERRRLWGLYLAWGFFDGALFYYWLFQHTGIEVAAYKAVLMLGWIPYQAIFMAVVRRQLCQHIFVVGMSAIWSFLQHNWSNIAVALLMQDSPEATVLTVHGGLYLLWFVLAFPLARGMFSSLLPSRKFFDLRPLGLYIAFLPLAIISGHMLLMADGRLWHTWPERLSRIYLPLFFFFFYRYVLLASREFYAQQRGEQNHQLLSGQLGALEEYSRLSQKNSEEIAVLRQELRGNYRAIHALLEQGETEGARKTIAAARARLEKARPVSYTKSPFLNSVLSVYINRAEGMGCKVSARIDLPEERHTSESDLALLLANVLLLAAKASTKQPEGRRELMLILRIREGKGTMELMNRHETPFPLDERGLPQEDKAIDEHGLGVLSLTTFVKKYGAKVSFCQQEGWVRLSLSWEDRSL